MAARDTAALRRNPDDIPSALVDEAIADAFEERESLPNGAAHFDPEFRFTLIQRAAYALAEQRGFEPGRELDDWLEAERAVDAGLA